MSDKDDNVATMTDSKYSLIIIIAAFSMATLLGMSLLGIGYMAVKGGLDIEKAKDILLVVIPVQTLIIGGLFGFIAGKKKA